MSSRRSFSADKQTRADMCRATRRRRVTGRQIPAWRAFLSFASANRGLTDNDLARERKRRESGPGPKKQRQNRQCRPAGRSVGRSSSHHLSCSCCFHCVVSLTLRVATREAKEKLLSLLLSLPPPLSHHEWRNQQPTTNECATCVCPAPSLLFCHRLCVSRSLFSLRYNVILPT